MQRCTIGCIGVVPFDAVFHVFSSHLIKPHAQDLPSLPQATTNRMSTSQLSTSVPVNPAPRPTRSPPAHGLRLFPANPYEKFKAEPFSVNPSNPTPDKGLSWTIGGPLILALGGGLFLGHCLTFFCLFPYTSFFCRVDFSLDCFFLEVNGWISFRVWTDRGGGGLRPGAGATQPAEGRRRARGGGGGREGWGNGRWRSWSGGFSESAPSAGANESEWA